MILALMSVAFATDVGGYLRVMTRPDFEGGDGRLGYWNLYGRLLNEGPYAALELRQDVLAPEPGSDEPWTDLHAKIEGGTIGSADAGNGSLAYLRLSQVYVQAGNIGLAGVTWRLGTLESTFGDLGLYDMRPAQVLTDAVGGGLRWQTRAADVILGVGDAGYSIRGAEYTTVLTAGGTARVSLGRHLEVGAGGQFWHEPEVVGNRYAPHTTPELAYEDYVRGEVVERYADANPDLSTFPDPEPTSAQSWKAVGYLGFGNLGPLKWNNLFANYLLRHPDNFVEESYAGETYTLYVKELTDERTQLNVGNELQLVVLPERLDVAWGVLYGRHEDGDNDVAPSDDDRTFYSTVLRAQVYLTPGVHLLAEGSVAKEISHNGNAYRNHVDSIFENAGGEPDAEGLEYGDDDERDTLQGKFGVVLNPLGPGIYTRPSLRLLYGIQHSSQNNAFGNSFVETLDQYDDFGNVERHVHSVVALEAEAWF
ncbi:MAG: hypothetical protein ACOZNI_37640 [Myxococcota bacterium]